MNKQIPGHEAQACGPGRLGRWVRLAGSGRLAKAARRTRLADVVHAAGVAGMAGLLGLAWAGSAALAMPAASATAATAAADRSHALLAHWPLDDGAGKLAAETVSGRRDPVNYCLLYTSPSPRDQRGSRMPSSA